MSGDIYDEFVRKFEKHKERADYYWEQKDYVQSWEDILESFQNYAHVRSIGENRYKADIGGRTPEYSIEVKLNVLLDIANFLHHMALCYWSFRFLMQDEKKILDGETALFQRTLLQKDMIEIFLILKEYEKHMTVKQLDWYQWWEKNALTTMTIKELERKNSRIEEAVKEKRIDQYIDSNIRKIYRILNQICELEICLLSTRELPGSSDFNWQSSLLSLVAFGIAYFATGQNIIAGIVAAVICWIVVSAIKGSDS